MSCHCSRRTGLPLWRASRLPWGRLTALRSLGLLRNVYHAPQQELLGLSALTQLASLRFSGPAANLQHVPRQLLELNIGINTDHPLHLQHLAAVTALTSAVQAGDVLPPNLLRLHVDDCGSVQPLLGLQQLQQLQLVFDGGCLADITAGQLRQLSRLTSLSLQYHILSVEPASAAVLPLLPLQRLELHLDQLSAPVCQCLAQLSGLTSLALQRCELTQPGLAQQLAVTLKQLSGLQQLELSQPGLVAGDNTTAEPSQGSWRQGMQQLAQAVGSLQRLRELDISRFPQLAAAAAVGSNSLTGLTAVTSLSLQGCKLTDAAVKAIVSQLPQLQSLERAV